MSIKSPLAERTSFTSYEDFLMQSEIAQHFPADGITDTWADGIAAAIYKSHRAHGPLLPMWLCVIPPQ